MTSPETTTDQQPLRYFLFQTLLFHEASMVAAHDLEEASALWLEEKPTAPLKRVGELPPMPDKPMRMTIKFS